MLSPAELGARARQAALASGAANFEPDYMRYVHYGRQGAAAEVRGTSTKTLGEYGMVSLDAVDGHVLGMQLSGVRDANHATYSAIFGLHFGSFGNLSLRWLYFLLGLAGAFLFYSGNLLYIEITTQAQARGPTDEGTRHGDGHRRRMHRLVFRDLGDLPRQPARPTLGCRAHGDRPARVLHRIRRGDPVDLLAPPGEGRRGSALCHGHRECRCRRARRHDPCRPPSSHPRRRPLRSPGGRLGRHRDGCGLRLAGRGDTSASDRRRSVQRVVIAACQKPETARELQEA